MTIKNILDAQKTYVKNWKQNIEKTKNQLILLKQTLVKYENEIYDALYKDLHKTKNETYLTEYQLVLNELNWFIKNFKRIYKKKHHFDNLWFLGHQSSTIFEPYGSVLIYSPYNYPFNLSMVPLIGAIACSNTVILKPSAVTENTSLIMKKIIEEVFDQNQCFAINPSEFKNNLYKDLYELDVDMVFFTGGEEIGKQIYQNYAKQLIPVVLELGGKCPVIIDDSADIEVAAKRIVWAKTINNAQTCVGPDYLIVSKNIYEKLIAAIIKQLKIQFNNMDTVANLSSQKALERINNLALNQKIIYEHNFNEQKSLKLIDVNDYLTNPIMKTEIFGPLLPIIQYEDKAEIYKIIQENNYPLALYIFSTNRSLIDDVIYKTKSGAIVVNDLLIHLTKHTPFGGIKNSGLGQYHKKTSIKTFMHEKSIIKTTKFDVDFRYQPFNEKKFQQAKRWMK